MTWDELNRALRAWEVFGPWCEGRGCGRIVETWSHGRRGEAAVVIRGDLVVTFDVFAPAWIAYETRRENSS